MIRILRMGDKFWVYCAPPVQWPIWNGKMYRVFDDLADAAEFRKTL